MQGPPPPTPPNSSGKKVNLDHCQDRKLKSVRILEVKSFPESSGLADSAVWVEPMATAQRPRRVPRGRRQSRRWPVEGDN